MAFSLQLCFQVFFRWRLIHLIKAKNQQSIEATHKVKQTSFQMKEALLRADFRRMAEILGDSWEAKKQMASGITNSHIDDVYTIALEAGAYSGKISGAGGGGFIMFMVAPLKKHSLSNILRQLNGQVINFHFCKYGTQSWIIE